MPKLFKKKVVVMMMSLPSKHIIEKFHMNNNLRECTISYWNFLPIVKKFNTPNKFKKNKVKNFVFISSTKQLIKLYKKLPKNFYYTNLTGNYFFTSFVELFLRIKGGKKFIVDFGRFIYPKLKTSLILENLNFIRDMGTIYFLKKIFFYLLEKMKKFINVYFLEGKPNYIFVSSKNAQLELTKRHNSAKIFRIDSEDYFKFLKSKKSNSNKYITFLDQGFDENFDFYLRNFYTYKFDSKNYWKKMNNFFDKIEKIFPEQKIVIAAHPRRLSNNIKKFTKREIAFNKTLEIISKSKMVFAHYSQAINLAVLLKKPIILLDLEDFKRQALVKTQSIKNFGKILDLKIINLDHKVHLRKIVKKKSIFKINPKKYEDFKNFYIGFPSKKSQGGTWKKIAKSL